MSYHRPPGTAGHLVRDFGLVQEFSDGTERVFFTPDELAAMAADPARFGLAFPICGHSTTYALSDGSCGECERLAEQAEYEALCHEDLDRDLYQQEEQARLLRDMRESAAGDIPF